MCGGIHIFMTLSSAKRFASWHAHSVSSILYTHPPPPPPSLSLSLSLSLVFTRSVTRPAPVFSSRPRTMKIQNWSPSLERRKELLRPRPPSKLWSRIWYALSPSSTLPLVLFVSALWSLPPLCLFNSLLILTWLKQVHTRGLFYDFTTCCFFFLYTIFFVACRRERWRTPWVCPPSTTAILFSSVAV